jgi:hypothetical protein
MKKLQVRLKSPWTDRVETELALFSRQIPADEADALLCEWAPDDELVTFGKRKAWYCCEPWCQFRGLGNGSWPVIRDRLSPREFLWHGHPDTRYRVPHVTHVGALEISDNQDRLPKAVAIVSNHGGNPLKRHPDISYRNGLITLPNVDLFGRCGWTRYRRSWYSLPAKPGNYCGELPGDWPGAEKRSLMSRYKVCICLENMNEPGYFTEKFVEAVCAGCVPVYRASADVRDGILQGACWFDPSDTRWPGKLAVEAALAANAESVRRVNRLWLQQNRLLQATSDLGVFSRIGQTLLDAQDEMGVSSNI